MVYVKRDADGNIVAVSEKPLEGFEGMEPDAELRQFLAGVDGRREELEQTDLDFIRVVEDVIELLIAKNVILFTELPAEAQEKMLTRQRLRSSLSQPLQLLPEDGFDSDESV